jgi:hypothetical protein
VRVSVAVVVKVVVGEAVHVALTVGPAKVGVLVGITNTVGAAATPPGEGGAVIAKYAVTRQTAKVRMSITTVTRL